MIRWLAVLALTGVTGTIAAQGQSEVPTLTGVVAFKGNEPFVYLALTDDQGRDWKLMGPAAKDLAQHQNQRVEIGVRQIPSATPGVPTSVEVLWFKVLS